MQHNDVPPPDQDTVYQYDRLNEVHDYVPGEMKLDPHGILYKKYLESTKPLGFLSDAFDNWIINILPLQIESRVITASDGSYAQFTNPFLERPMLSEARAQPEPLWPKVAMEQNRDYSGALYADLVLRDKDGVLLKTREKVYLGLIPIMLGSYFDHASALADDPIALLAKGQCHVDPGKYFQIKGREKVVMIHDKSASMKPMIYKKQMKQEGNYIATVCQLTNEIITGSNVIYVLRDKEDKVSLRMTYFGKAAPINPLVIFKLFGIDNIDNILKYILDFTETKWVNKLLGKLMKTYVEFTQIGDPVEYLIKIWLKYRRERKEKKGKDKKKKKKEDPTETLARMNYDEKKEFLLSLLRKNMFPQVSEEPEEDNRRLAMLAQLIVRLLENFAGLRKLDVRDDWSNKRLDTAASSFKQLFQTLFDMIIEGLQDKVEDVINIDSLASQVNADAIMTKHLSKSISGPMWGLKGKYQKNIVGPLERSNIVDVYSTLTRIRVNNQEKSNTMIAPRMVQPTACGFICPAETPERKGCGFIKNLSAGAEISIHNPATDKMMIDIINPFVSLSKSSTGTTKCWFNGIFMGWCNGIQLREFLVAKRRQKKLPKGVAITLDNFNYLWVMTVSSRPIRLLLIVNTETGNLVIDEKNLWNADLDQLLEEGAVEYLDPFEMNHAYVAESLYVLEDTQKSILNATINLAKVKLRLELISGQRVQAEELGLPEDYLESLREQVGTEQIDQNVDLKAEMASSETFLAEVAKKGSYTHVELDPSKLLGFVGSNIPMYNYSYAVRAAFQCHMGKKALGIYHSQQRHRYETTTKRLAYPSRSVFSSRTELEIGMKDLPAGQLSIVAVSMYDGWNQEDSAIINEAALQRGLLRYVMEFTIDVKEAKKKDLIYEERIRFPAEIKPSEAHAYRHLDRNGIAKVGSLIKLGDVIVAIVRVYDTKLDNSTEKSAENVSRKAGLGESGIVDKVVITHAADGSKIVMVRIRDTRIPQAGDKVALIPAQKATIGIVYSEVDMPRTASGVIPDIIFNPLAFPSRMTIGTIIEILTSKTAVMTGSRINATAFQKFDLELFYEELHRLGYQRHGDEAMYSGITGQKMDAAVFIGPAYVQKLKHDVIDKINVRSRGRIDPVTREPSKGRSVSAAAQKIGEMETHSFMAHGAASVLCERTFLSSDATDVIICQKCNTLQSISSIDPKQICPHCGAVNSFGRAKLPYITKVFDQTIQGTSEAIKYHTRLARS